MAVPYGTISVNKCSYTFKGTRSFIAERRFGIFGFYNVLREILFETIANAHTYLIKVDLVPILCSPIDTNRGCVMRTLIIFIISVLLPFSSVSASHCKSLKYSVRNKHVACLKDVEVDIDDGSIIFTEKDNDHERVEITEEYELYVNGRLVEVNEKQQRLIEAYYDLYMDIIRQAKKIGYEGAKIGAKGAKLGLKAVAGVLRLLGSDYDSDDLERDLKREARKLEDRAEKLQEKAEKIEQMADELEDVHNDLRDRIPELRELDWF